MRVLIAGIGRFDGAGASVGETAYMEQVPAYYQGTLTAIGGFLDSVQELGLDTLCLAVARVGPEGIIDRELHATVQARIMWELRGWKIDAAYLALDGRLAYGDDENSQGEPAADLLKALKRRLGKDVPLVASFDVDPPKLGELSSHADAVIVPADLPGFDAVRRGQETARRLQAILPEESRGMPVAPDGPATGPVMAGNTLGKKKMRLGFADDLCAGTTAGETVTLELYVSGLSHQSVSVGIFICDEVGVIRWDVREDREITADPCVLRFGWPVQAFDPPGVYSVRGMVYSARDRWQGVSGGTVEVLNAEGGRRAPAGRMPPVPRDRLLASPYRFGPPQAEEMAQWLQRGEATERAIRNVDGSWGIDSRDRRNPKHVSVYHRTADVINGYLIGYEINGDASYEAEARRGLAFLLKEQLPNGGWCPWAVGSVTPEWVWPKEFCFYDSGSIGRALMEAHRVLGDAEYLKAVERAVRYVESEHYTGNNNYDAYLLWFLGPYCQVTGDEQALTHALARCREAVLVGQQPNGGFPAHNSSVAYQAITAYGLLCLYEALPDDHPYRSTLRRRTIMAVNNLIWLMDEKGHFFSGWEYDRTFGVTIDGRPKGIHSGPPTSTLVAVLYKADRLFGLDEQVFYGVCQGFSMRDVRSGDMGLLGAATLLRWARERHVAR